MDQPDPADVAAARDGDEAAFERIVRLMHGRVWRYLIHLVHDPHLAQDVAQEVFVRVYRNLDSLRDPERFAGWVFSIARNAAYDHGRARKRRPLELLGDRDVTTAGPSHDPHVSIETADALARLDPDLRQAVLLVGMIGLTYDEAADSLGIPTGTVKSRVFRARRQLLELLELDDD